ncbi:MAG: hypothetical protein IKI64_01480 [Clostridia bacterium]|nr:hypothetical protein [Clostridia bacterium]
MDELPPIEKGGDYALIFELGEGKYASANAFMNTLLGLLLARAAESKQTAAAGSALNLYCNTERAEDGVNSLKLFKKRAE